MLLAVAMVVLSGSAAALAQSVPVTVEIEGSEHPTDPTEPPGHDPSPTEPASPAPLPGEEPPPAAPDPQPDEPLARTGADVLRTVRDAAGLIAAGLLLLVTTRKPERNAR